MSRISSCFISALLVHIRSSFVLSRKDAQVDLSVFRFIPNANTQSFRFSNLIPWYVRSYTKTPKRNIPFNCSFSLALQVHSAHICLFVWRGYKARTYTGGIVESYIYIGSAFFLFIPSFLPSFLPSYLPTFLTYLNFLLLAYFISWISFKGTDPRDETELRELSHTQSINLTIQRAAAPRSLPPPSPPTSPSQSQLPNSSRAVTSPANPAVTSGLLRASDMRSTEAQRIDVISRVSTITACVIGL